MLWLVMAENQSLLMEYRVDESLSMFNQFSSEGFDAIKSGSISFEWVELWLFVSDLFCGNELTDLEDSLWFRVLSRPTRLHKGLNLSDSLSRKGIFIFLGFSWLLNRSNSDRVCDSRGRRSLSGRLCDWCFSMSSYEFFFIRKKLILYQPGLQPFFSFIHSFIHCFHRGNIFPKKWNFVNWYIKLKIYYM